MKSFDIYEHINLIQTQFGSFYRTFHHFDRMMKEWGEVFRLVDDKKREPMVANIKTPSGEELATETYEQELVFEDERVFIFEWDIVLATYELQKKGQQMDIELLPYLPFIDKSQLSFTNKENRQPHLPIILLNAHKVLNTHIILNGNHRMVEAYQQGKSHIKGYYLKDLSHLNWMTSDKMKAMYEFLSDIRVVDHVLTLTGSSVQHDQLYNQLIISRLHPKVII